jgi:aldose 1-epimerase
MAKFVDLQLSAPSGNVTARIGVRGAQLKSLQRGGVEFIQQHEETPEVPWSAGIVMAPWVNRIDGGKWTQNGITHTLPITDETYRNAIHGLVCFEDFQILAQTESAVRLGRVIKSTDGYPFEIDFRVEYHLQPDGIAVRHIAVNKSTEPAPFATGAHPYVILGDEPLDRATIRVAARTYVASDERMLPVSREFTDNTPFDLTGGVVVDHLRVDTSYGNIQRTDDGIASASLIGSGLGLELWQDSKFTYTHIFVTPNFSGPTGKCLALAIEPTTGPANNFNTGESLIWLSPEKIWKASWGIRLLDLN